MDSQESLNNTEPPLCANGCGFYGSVQNQNLCSKCYKDLLKEELAKSDKAATSIEKPQNPTTQNSLDSSMAQLSDNAAFGGLTSTKKRCKSCNKKVGITGFHCRCGNLFCGMHRYPEEHACSVDLKALGRNVLESRNPVCKVDKLEWRI